MTTVQVNTTTADGYIVGGGGHPSGPTGGISDAWVAYNSNDLFLSSSSSQDAQDSDVYLFFNTAGQVPAGATINSIALYIYCNTSSIGSGAVLWWSYCNNACAGSTFGLSDNGIPFGTAYGYFPYEPTGGWAAADLGTGAYNNTGYVNVRLGASAFDLPGDYFIFDSANKAGGNPAYLLIDYTPAATSVSRLTLLGAG